MRYLVTLKPLEPFLFGGDMTFGSLEKSNTYLVKSRLFPQQTAVLGMLRKEVMIQEGLLTRKVNGEWVDNPEQAKKLVGSKSFDFTEEQDFGVIKEISPLFLMNGNNRYIKKVDIDKCEYKDGVLEGYDPKENIFDSFSCIDDNKRLKQDDIYQEVSQVGIKKVSKEDGYFKKFSYLLKDNFKFAFYLDIDYELSDSIVTLGAEKSKFKLEVVKTEDKLKYSSKYLTLLSDTYIDIPLQDNCDFAVTSEISIRTIKSVIENRHTTFKKSKKLFFYEKGSVIFNPSEKLINNINNKNLQKIGYNKIGEIK